MSRVITPLGVCVLARCADATWVLGLGVGELRFGALAGLGVEGFGVVAAASGIIARSAFAAGACGAGLGAGDGCSFADSFEVGVGVTTASCFCGPCLSVLALAAFAGFGAASFAAGGLRAGASFGSSATLDDWGAGRAAVSADPISAASEVAGIRVPARGVSATTTVFEGVVSSFRLGVGDDTARMIRLVGGVRSDGSRELISATAGRSPSAKRLVLSPIGLPRRWDCDGARASLRLTSTGGRPLPPITTVLCTMAPCARVSLLPNRARPMLKNATVAQGQSVGWPHRPCRPIRNGKGDNRFREDSSAPQ